MAQYEVKAFSIKSKKSVFLGHRSVLLKKKKQEVSKVITI